MRLQNLNLCLPPTDALPQYKLQPGKGQEIILSFNKHLLSTSIGRGTRDWWKGQKSVHRPQDDPREQYTRSQESHQAEATRLSSHPTCVSSSTHLLELQLDDLLLEGISFVLSLHVSLLYAVLLRTETSKWVISQLQNSQ